MEPLSFAAWLTVLPSGVLAVLFGITGLREGKARASLVGGASIGGFTLMWALLLSLFPLWHGQLLIAYLLSAVILFGLLFFPFGKKADTPAPPAERVDERVIMFARFRYSPGDGRYEAFYSEYPELQEFDDRLRTLPRLGQPGSLTYDPLNAPVQDALFGWIERIRDTASGPTAERRTEISPEDAARRLKGLAIYLGAVAVGTTAVQTGHVYSRIGRGGGEWGAPLDPADYPHALVFAVEMKEEMVGSAPLQPVVVDSSRQYVEAAKIALTVANYIRTLGWPARAHIDGNYRLVMPPLAADAGLGEVGRLSLLITPGYGPRVRLGAVTTSLRLPQDKPINFGVDDFCRHCLKCARNCPSRAISLGDTEPIRGTRYWKIDPESCFEYWLRAGTDCGICVAVCPYSHPRGVLHSLVRVACRMNLLSRRLFSRADDLFYGPRPISTRYPAWMKAGMAETVIKRLGVR
jgi:ferredoxin